MNTNDIMPGLELDVLSLDDLDALADEIVSEKERRKVKRALTPKVSYVTNVITEAFLPKIVSFHSPPPKNGSTWETSTGWETIRTATGELNNLCIREHIYLEGEKIGMCEYKITVEGKAL